MKILSWNRQGLLKSSAFKYLCIMLNIYNLDCMFLSENKTSSSFYAVVQQHLGYFDYFYVPAMDCAGVLCFMWMFNSLLWLLINMLLFLKCVTMISME